MRNLAFEFLRGKIRESDLESVLIGKRTNLRYITGFTGDYGFAAVGSREALFFTSSLQFEHANSTVREPFKVVEVRNDIFKALADPGVSLWGKRLGYEAETVTCSDFEKIKAAFKGIDLISTSGMVEEIRTIKKPSEIRSIIRAQRITEEVFVELLGFMKEGVKERDLACEIDYRLRKHGGELSAFDTIVAFGENTSKPHALPSQRKLKAGDIVLFDMGTIIDGYASDMTRTVVFGRADSKIKKLYAAVLEAQEAALSGIKAGIKCSEADSLARNVIDRAGYGDLFIHFLGHGVGLDVHEIPSLSRRSNHRLKHNMVVTVEPGVYLPGWGGIRIEDMVVVDDNGCDNLTGADKALIEL